MKVDDFCDAFGVSGNSYRRFLGQHGPHKGMESDCYNQAHGFFVRRGEQGIQPPRKKAKSTKANKDAKNDSSKAKSKDQSDQDKIKDIHLNGGPASSPTSTPAARYARRSPPISASPGTPKPSSCARSAFNSTIRTRESPHHRLHPFEVARVLPK